MADMTKPLGRRPRGRELNRGHLTDDMVREMRRSFFYGATLETVAKQFKTSIPNAWLIKRGRTWKHVQ